jgi:hypothetical protein
MAPDRRRKADYLSIWQFNPNKAKGSQRIHQALPQMTAIGRDQQLNIGQNSVSVITLLPNRRAILICANHENRHLALNGITGH